MQSIRALLKSWHRGLTTNHARLEPGAADPLLRPLWFEQPVDKVGDHIQHWVQGADRWSLKTRSQHEQGTHLHLVRRTRWLGFEDDVQVRLSSERNLTRVDAESQARIGIGDFGQNRRNLKELISGIGDR